MTSISRAIVVLAIAAGLMPIDRDSSLSGVVTDTTGHPLSDVTVFVHHAGQGTFKTAETDSAGRYSVTVPSGSYSIDFDNLGFNVHRTNDVVIPA